jgi:hypothetical protein
MMDLRVRLQLSEAFGSVNRWFCSEAHGREITDLELLLIYYIKSGGAADFAERFNQATGMLNRWYCSEFHGREIHEPQILWEYYMSHAPVQGKNQRYEPAVSLTELSIAC